jgi:hypothetical protein
MLSRTKLIAALAFALLSSPALALNIVFDYDNSSGFFTNERRDAIERAASVYEHYIANDLNLFITMETIHQGPFLARVSSSYGSDFQSDWSGTIIYTKDLQAWDWYSGVDENLDPYDDIDLFTVTLHELGHVLGVGTADTWYAQITDDNFYGINAIGVYGAAVPLVGRFNDDLAIDVKSTLPGTETWQRAVFEATSYPGERQHLTTLDLAVLADIGWTVTSIPEPETYAMLLAGLGVVGAITRRKRVRVATS